MTSDLTESKLSSSHSSITSSTLSTLVTKIQFSISDLSTIHATKDGSTKAKELTISASTPSFTTSTSKESSLKFVSTLSIFTTVTTSIVTTKSDTTTTRLTTRIGYSTNYHSTIHATKDQRII